MEGVDGKASSELSFDAGMMGCTVTPAMAYRFAKWTSMPGGGNNIHRNVIYRDGGDLARQMLPFTTEKPLGSEDPRELWKWMAKYEERTGGKLLAISHNGNVSNGILFPVIEPSTGKPIDLEYAQSRERWEPLYEAVQSKGDSETHPFLSPNDEFCDYEPWDFGNIGLTAVKTDEITGRPTRTCTTSSGVTQTSARSVPMASSLRGETPTMLPKPPGRTASAPPS